MRPALPRPAAHRSCVDAIELSGGNPFIHAAVLRVGDDSGAMIQPRLARIVLRGAQDPRTAHRSGRARRRSGRRVPRRRAQPARLRVLPASWPAGHRAERDCGTVRSADERGARLFALRRTGRRLGSAVPARLGRDHAEHVVGILLNRDSTAPVMGPDSPPHPPWSPAISPYRPAMPNSRRKAGCRHANGSNAAVISSATPNFRAAATFPPWNVPNCSSRRSAPSSVRCVERGHLNGPAATAGALAQVHVGDGNRRLSRRARTTIGYRG